MDGCRACHVFVFALLSLLGFYGCATPTSSNQGISLEQVSQKPDVLSFPYRLYGNGIWVIDAQIGSDSPRPFIVDTGATRSAIFETYLSDLGLEPSSYRAVNVYGMTGSEAKPTTRIPAFKFGDKTYIDYEVVVLKDRLDNVDKNLEPVGIIGMDLLKDFQIYANAEQQRLNLIPKTFQNVVVPNNWRTIYLTPNPFKDEDRGLHFMDLRIGNNLVTALFDTGSEINAVSWDSLDSPLVRDAKRKLRKQWVIQGATGEFDPVGYVMAENFRSGQKFWDRRKFYLMNFEDLEILGVSDKAFAIAGGNLFTATSVYVDFEKNVLRLKPEEKDLNVMKRRDGDIVVRPERATRM